MTTTNVWLCVWAGTATGLGMYFRADARWWRRQAKDGHRVMERSIPPASAQPPRPGEPAVWPQEGRPFERPFERAKLPPRKSQASLLTRRPHG